MTKQRLKIVAVNKFGVPTGGADTFYIKLNNALRGRGHRVLEFNTRQFSSPVRDGDATFVWGLSGDDIPEASPRALLRAYAHGIWNAEARREMRKLLERVRPDVVHLHNVFYQLSHSIIEPIRRLDIPIVLTLHDYHPVCASNYLYFRGRLCEDCKHGIHHILANRCFRDSLATSSMAFFSMLLRSRRGAYFDQIAHVVSPSRFLLGKIAEFGLPIASASVLPVFYEPPPAALTSRLGEGILYLGQLLEQKGVADLLSVAATSSLPFLFGGRGPLKRDVERAASERKNVRYLGFVTGEAMEKVFGEALCLAVPSRWWENAPAVILDAYARQRPVVAAAVGGIPELVEDGVTGVLFPPGDTGALLDALEQLARQPQLAASMGQAGRKRVLERHSVEQYLDQMEQVYWGLVG